MASFRATPDIPLVEWICILKQGGIGAGSDKPAFWRTDQWHLQEVALLQIRLRWLLASPVLFIIYVPLLCLPCANSCIRRSPGGGHRKQNCDNWIASCWYFPINFCSGLVKLNVHLKTHRSHKWGHFWHVFWSTVDHIGIHRTTVCFWEDLVLNLQRSWLGLPRVADVGWSLGWSNLVCHRGHGCECIHLLRHKVSESLLRMQRKSYHEMDHNQQVYPGAFRLFDSIHIHYKCPWEHVWYRGNASIRSQFTSNRMHMSRGQFDLELGSN